MIIRRDGRPPLQFDGELVAQASSNTGHRTWLVSVYRTDGGTYVCQRILRTTWQGETDWHDAAVATPGEWLPGMPELPGRIGFPDAPQFEDRQRVLLDQLERDYDRCVSEVLESGGFTEVVV